MPDMPRLPDRPAHTSQHKHLEPLDGHVERLRRSGRQRKPRLGEKKKVGIEDRTMRSAPWGRVDRLHPTVHDSSVLSCAQTPVRCSSTSRGRPVFRSVQGWSHV